MGMAVLNHGIVFSIGKRNLQAVASTQSSSIVAARYANALIALSESAKVLDKVEADLRDFTAMIENSQDLATTIRSPLHGQESLTKAIMALANKAKFQDITKNFLGLLIQNRRLNIVTRVIKSFNAKLDERRGAMTVNIEVAQDLSTAQKKSLEAALKKAMGKDVAVIAHVKPEILGGMIVTIGSTMIDDSVRRKLERLKVSMGAISNENMKLKEVS